jgi:uncharacterized protein
MISDTSPLIFLSKINALYILKRLYNTIKIPEMVKEELYSGGREDILAISKEIEEGGIKVLKLKKEIIYTGGKGENAAINLAVESKENLLIDDFHGIRIAESLGIEICRTTTIVLKALQKKIINKNEALILLKRLLDNNYYISPRFYAELLEKILKL